MSQYLRLHANCILVSGAKKTLICDLQRSQLFSVPDGIRAIFEEQTDLTVEELYAHYGEALAPRLTELFNFLLSEDLAFYTDEPEAFPALDRTWKHPSTITNAILDFDASSVHDVAPFIQQLGEWGCQALELRFYCTVSQERLNVLLEQILATKIRHLVIFLQYEPALLEWNFDHLFAQYQRLAMIVAHSAPHSEALYESTYFKQVGVQATTQLINSEAHCGLITPGFFNTNVPLFTEAQAHNSCLNRKISVDARGRVRNCPSMPQDFGHVDQVVLTEVLNQPDFTRWWSISKNEIDKCKSCEYRYVCTDCRAYVEDPTNAYAAPLKCGYDPETGAWSEWSENPLKQQAIRAYQLPTTQPIIEFK